MCGNSFGNMRIIIFVELGKETITYVEEIENKPILAIIFWFIRILKLDFSSKFNAAFLFLKLKVRTLEIVLTRNFQAL